MRGKMECLLQGQLAFAQVVPGQSTSKPEQVRGEAKRPFMEPVHCNHRQ